MACTSGNSPMKEAQIMKQCGSQLRQVAERAYVDGDMQRAIDNYTRAALAYEDAASVFDMIGDSGYVNSCSRNANHCRRFAAQATQRRNRDG